MASTPPIPPTEPPAPPERSLAARMALAQLSATQRDVLLVLVALALGVLVMPFLIWLAGSRVLGGYTHGDNLKAGPWALFADYVVGLAHGSAVFWLVALGPLALLLLARGFLHMLHVVPQLRRNPPGGPPDSLR